MRITYDPNKQVWTLAERGLDFAEADEVLQGRHMIVSTIDTITAKSEWSPQDT